ncbi:MAG: fimbria/pilus outer membrane usher protein, partial [Nostoc sp.]
SSTFTERTAPSWVRNDLRLVHDAPDQALRYVIGDLSVPISGYQSSRPLLGVAVARNFSLQPYRVTRPISQFEFFLETPSKVEVFINGLPVQTLQLPGGRQDIRDLPLSGGINDVQLIITDAVGRVQR